MKVVITCDQGHRQEIDLAGYSREWREGFCFLLNKSFDDNGSLLGSVVGKCCTKIGLMKSDFCGSAIKATVQE